MGVKVSGDLYMTAAKHSRHQLPSERPQRIWVGAIRHELQMRYQSRPDVPCMCRLTVMLFELIALMVALSKAAGRMACRIGSRYGTGDCSCGTLSTKSVCQRQFRGPHIEDCSSALTPSSSMFPIIRSMPALGKVPADRSSFHRPSTIPVPTTGNTASTARHPDIVS